ncbi:hypothetical protein Tco_0015462 [Tanacetum coccineum]
MREQSCGFRRYLNRKRENRKWLNKAIDEGPYEFKEFTPSETEEPRMQKEEDLRGDYLKHYEGEAQKALEKSRRRRRERKEETTSPYYVTHLSSVVDYDNDYQGDTVKNTSEDPLTSAMILLANAVVVRLQQEVLQLPRQCTKSLQCSTGKTRGL